MNLKKLVKILILPIITIVFIFSSFTPGVLAEQKYDFINSSGVGSTANATGHANQKFFNGAEGSIEIGASQIINVILSFLGVIFLVLMVYAGVLWMMAQGNEKNVEKAKGIITGSIIGLIIIAAAYAISYFILDLVSKGLTSKSIGT